MDIEIRPKKINSTSLTFGIAGILITAVFGGFVFPPLIDSYFEFPKEAVFRNLLILSTAITILFLFFIAWIVIYSIGRKLTIKGNLVTFYKKTFSGFGVWKIEKIIDFSKINLISDKHRTSFIFTGKSIIPIIFYWLILEMKDGKKEEFLVSGWDFFTLKEVLKKLKECFPEVKFSTTLVKDSPEKLSGIDKYL